MGKFDRVKKLKKDVKDLKTLHENKIIWVKFFISYIIKSTLDQGQDFYQAYEYYEPGSNEFGVPK